MEAREKKHTVEDAEQLDEIDYLSEILISMLNADDDDLNELYFIPMQELLQTYSDREIDWDYLENEFNYDWYYLASHLLEPEEVVKYIRNIKFDGFQIERTISKKDSRNIVKRIKEKHIKWVEEYIEFNEKDTLNKFFIKD